MKNKKGLSFFTSLLILFLVVSVAIFFLKGQNKPEIIHPKIWTIQLFFIAVFSITQFISGYALKYKPGSLHIFHMGVIGIRFIASAIFVLVFLYNNSAYRLTFAVDFFILYLAYSWFEIYFLLRNLRADSKKDAEGA
jgi:hypothetical protein